MIFLKTHDWNIFYVDLKRTYGASDLKSVYRVTFPIYPVQKLVYDPSLNLLRSFYINSKIFRTIRILTIVLRLTITRENHNAE